MPSKFVRSAVAVASPVRTTAQDTLTHEGGPGWSRDPKSELFLLAVSNMVGEDTFYEAANQRDDRFHSLIAQVAREDSDWLARFIPYLRNEMHLRSASVVMAAETVHANLSAGRSGNRSLIDSALARADEPAEMLAYWHARYGRTLPMPVKRGISDAATRLYNERAVIKYDGQASSYRMGDVIELTHAKPKAEWQSHLYGYLIARRHNREGLHAPESCPTLTAYEALPSEGFREAFSAELVEHAGLTWESASTRYGVLDAPFWQAMIPNMGYMALLRNLRNFDDAGIDSDSKSAVIVRLSDPEQVAKSRQLPLRFYSAWKAARSLTWGGAIESALNCSVANVPTLKGRTLVLVDTSGSMSDHQSARSHVERWEIAALFGAALALRAESANLVSFQSDTREYHLHGGDAVLRLMDAIKGHVGGGTNTFQAVASHFSGHDRIVILTDEQAHPGYGYQPLPNVPIYTFNLAGYKAGHLASGTDRQFTFGGLTDAGFRMIELIERAGHADWPF